MDNLGSVSFAVMVLYLVVLKIPSGNCNNKHLGSAIVLNDMYRTKLKVVIWELIEDEKGLEFVNVNQFGFRPSNLGLIR